MRLDADISASVDLLGKSVTDLQSGVTVGNNSISGTLKYVTGYTGFSGDVSMQSGNFLALHADVPGVDDVTYTVKLTNPVTLDEDQTVVLYIADVDTQTLTVTASKDGLDDVTKVYSLKGLTCLDH